MQLPHLPQVFNISTFSFSFYGLNWLDLLIVGVFLFYIAEGIVSGFVISFIDLLSFVGSFLLALLLYGFLGGFLASTFHIPTGFAQAFGFLFSAVISEFILGLLLRRVLYKHLIHWFGRKKDVPLGLGRAYGISINHVLGAIPGFISAFVLLAFFLSLVATLPFSPPFKKALANSQLGNKIVIQSSAFEKSLNAVFGGAVNDSLTFLTVKPEGDEFVELHYTTANVSVDSSAEQTMLQMVNKERTSRGLEPLTFDDSLRDVARKHSKDMFARGYFSHFTPEGYSPFDRMKQAGITYGFAGENLALAPTVGLAMQGLMNSPGHKANMLSPDFRKVGIGVIDGGIYGEMFSQEFTD